MAIITEPELKLLLLVASPLTAWRSEGDPTAQLLVRAEMMEETQPGIGRITALGLRVLAGAIERGLHKHAIESMISGINNRQRTVSKLAGNQSLSAP